MAKEFYGASEKYLEPKHSLGAVELISSRDNAGRSTGNALLLCSKGKVFGDRRVRVLLG